MLPLLYQGKAFGLERHNNTKTQRLSKFICFLLNNNKPHCFGAVWDPNEKATNWQKPNLFTCQLRIIALPINILYWPTVATTPAVISYCLWKRQNEFLSLTSITSNKCNKIVLCHTNQPCGASGDTAMIGFGTQRNNTRVYENLDEAYSQVSTGGGNFFALDFIHYFRWRLLV